MPKADWTLKATLIAIAVLLAIVALWPFADPGSRVMAQSARFDHVYLVSPLFVYKGAQGLLVMDRRNANVWFIPKSGDQFQAPVYVTRVPFEKLDQPPPQ